MAYLMFNEDATHFAYTRTKGGAEPLTMAHVEAFIEKHAHTGVKDFFVNVGSSVPFYPSRRFKSIYEAVKAGKLSEASAYLKSTYEFYLREGVSLPEAMLSCLKRTDMRSWISIRMDDVHECYYEDSPLWSEFFRVHKDEWNLVPHRKRTDYHEYELNYLVPEVYEYYLDLIEDALENFDADGVELDFLREAYVVGLGRETEGVLVLTRFMRDVKALAEKASETRGHAIKVAVRVPSSPERALRLGFDVCTWAEERLVDHVTVSSRWKTTNNDMPIDLWKRLLRGTGVTLAAGIERLVDSGPTSETPHVFQSYASAAGSAYAYLCQEVDAIYLFNCFDGYGGCFETEYFFCNDDEQRKRFLMLGADREALRKEPRRHVVTFEDVTVTGMANQEFLPCTLCADRNRYTPLESSAYYRRLRVATGDIDADKQLTVTLSFTDTKGFAMDDLQVYLNQRPCTFLRREEDDPALRPTGCETLTFRCENDGKMPPVAVIEVGLLHGTARLVWAEVGVN